MKALYLTLSSVIGFAGIIIIVENFGVTAPGMYIFLDTHNGTLSYPLFLIMSIGIITGFFLALTLKTSKKTDIHENFDEEDI